MGIQSVITKPGIWLHPNRLVAPKLKDVPDYLKSVESKWKTRLSNRFARERFVGDKDQGTPRYILSMFPYPSGRLHLGHARIYTSGDILARYSKLLCKNPKSGVKYSHVINPMGFDSFGLPAENAARERGLNPITWTNSNIRSMKQQLDDLALDFDWREATSNPSFYKWTQELFLKLLDRGLVYKSFAKVNWDPVDRTVLADEQVDAEGRSWRSGAFVEKRYYKQWFVKVNAFTAAIYEADNVDPESWRDVLAIQRNWIGKPSGWLYYIPIHSSDFKVTDTLPVFTDKPELLLRSPTKLVISQDHWLEKVHSISSKGFIDNPLTGQPLKVILNDGSIDLPKGTNATLVTNEADINENNTITRDQALQLAKLNGLGGYFTSSNYRDWLVSRQRFWGTPIPALNCDNCGVVGVPRHQLPVTLPKVENFDLKSIETSPQDSFQVVTPLQQLAPTDWIKTKCQSCGSDATRECETFDTLFDSSWYFLRYAHKPLSDKPYDSNMVQPTWCYIGGLEHAAMHLFYARFMTHFLHSLGQLNFKEPFDRLLVQGVVKSRTYSSNGKYLTKQEADNLEDKNQLKIEFEKMSKSKGNGIDPSTLLEAYGIDATRFCLMSYANPRTERLWRSNDEEYLEVINYLRRVILTVQEYSDVAYRMLNKKDTSKAVVLDLDNGELEKRKLELIEARNKASLGCIFNIQETYQFRQYISTLHVLLGSIRPSLGNSSVYTKECAETMSALIVMLSPIVPHLCEELWAHFSQCLINPLRNDSDTQYDMSLQVSDQPWPLPDEDYPLHVRVRPHNSDKYIADISVTKAQLRLMDKSDITKLVEDHFAQNGDRCRVLVIDKFADLKVNVVCQMDSFNKDAHKKMNKNRKENKNKIDSCH